MNALPSHLGELGIPEVIPKRIVGYIGDTSVEADLIELPAMVNTDAVGERLDIVVRVVVTEGGLGRAVEVLAVHESHGSFDSWFGGHGLKITPPEAVTGVSSGE